MTLIFFLEQNLKAPLVLTHIWITHYQTASNLKYKSHLLTVGEVLNWQHKPS